MSAEERRAVELLLQEGGSFFEEGRYADALRAAEKAREGATPRGDIGLEVRAVGLEAEALRMLGRDGDALSRYSWILAVAEDPVHARGMAEERVASAVVTAFSAWTNSAIFLPAIQVDRLFEVLDAGERFVRGIGKPTWRAGLLHMRATVLQQLGRVNEAIGFAEEGLALELRDRAAPGVTLGTRRWGLGDLLCDVERFDEARGLYRAVLDDVESGPHDRFVALRGLVRCCLATGDGAGAHTYASDAVRLAEPMGDDALSLALADLTDGCLALGDVTAARVASDRHMEVTRRHGGAMDLFHALRRAAKVAFAEKDAARARTFLAEAHPHAEALDRARDLHVYRAHLDKLRARLTALEAGPSPG